jgi:hypothetical protein
LATGPDKESDYSLMVMMAKAEGQPIWVRRYEGASIYPGNLSLSAGNELTISAAVFKGGARDPFVVRMDFDGQPIWGWSFSLPGDEQLNTLRVDEQGHLLIAGSDRLTALKSFEGWAVLLDGLGAPLDSTELKGARSIVSDGQEISGGRYRLIGETTRFGAQGIDAICMDWRPRATAPREVEREPLVLVPHTLSLDAAPFKPKHSSITQELDIRTLILGDPSNRTTGTNRRVLPQPDRGE